MQATCSDVRSNDAPSPCAHELTDRQRSQRMRMLDIGFAPTICRYFNGVKSVQKRLILAESSIDTVSSN